MKNQQSRSFLTSACTFIVTPDCEDSVSKFYINCDGRILTVVSSACRPVHPLSFRPARLETDRVIRVIAFLFRRLMPGIVQDQLAGAIVQNHSFPVIRVIRGIAV